jgi:hypothetical protein
MKGCVGNVGARQRRAATGYCVCLIRGVTIVAIMSE